MMASIDDIDFGRWHSEISSMCVWHNWHIVQMAALFALDGHMWGGAGVMY